MEYIKKNIAGQNTQQAKGKLKRMTRLIQAIEQVGMEAALATNWSQLDVNVTTSTLGVEEADRRVRALHLPSTRPPQLHLHLRAEQRSGDLVIRTRDLQVGWPDEKPLFNADDIELRRTDCAALIGPNGAGKSTFLKTVLGKLPPLEGEVMLGASLNIGYFAQAHEGLNPENTLIQEIQYAAPNMSQNQARQYLGKFLFSGDDAFKNVDVLSGGERGRLALAKLALEDTNLLLLDEPTNHLDIPSQEILEQVLEAYQGTVLLVSHDRYLIDALGTQVWEIDPDNSRLMVFKGTYSELRAQREAAAQAARMPGAAKKAESRPTPDAAPQVQSTPSLSKEAIKEQRQRQAKLKEIENAIASIESKLAEIGRALESPNAPEEIIRLSKEYEATQSQMESRLSEWEGLQG